MVSIRHVACTFDLNMVPEAISKKLVPMLAVGGRVIKRGCYAVSCCFEVNGCYDTRCCYDTCCCYDARQL